MFLSDLDMIVFAKSYLAGALEYTTLLENTEMSYYDALDFLKS